MELYKFSNLLGTVYTKGNVAFTPDGNTIITPVGNRTTLYDLKNNTTFTLSVEGSHNYTAIAISPNGLTLVAGNEIGEVHVISLISRTMVHCLKLGQPISFIKFSPDGKHFLLVKNNTAFVYNAPSSKQCFNPFVMERVFSDSTSNITFAEWSFDSKLVAFGSEDMMIRVYSLEKYKNFKNSSFTGHSDAIMGCFFESTNYNMYSISRNSQLCVWECTGEPSEFMSEKPKDSKNAKVDSEEDQKQEFIRFKKEIRHYYSELFKGLNNKPTVTCVDFHSKTKIVVTGFSNGLFCIHELPEFTLVHSFSISENQISTISINCSGEWIGFGCPTLGQLLVWEWQSDSYILKQQGHFNTMNAFDYSPDGRLVATGGEDGKVKVWNTSTSFCFVTFSEHSADITGIIFTQNGKAVLSSSLDGTVRAFDLTRYRNFRTFTSPRPVQFSCVSIDASKAFVAAGGQDVFDIYLWSMRSGALLEILSGHEGPVSQIVFNPNIGSSQLASVSWDKTLRLWESLDKSAANESFDLPTEGTCLAFRPDGKQVAVGTLDSQITFYQTTTSTIAGSIEGRNHLGSGRSDTDLVTAKTSLQGKAFTTMCYSADGTSILAGGQSKNICMYDTEAQILINKFQVTQNQSFDAVNEFVNHRKMSEFGNMSLVMDRDGQDGLSDKISLPGAKKGDMASRVFKPEVRVSCLRFSPTGRSFGATTTEGLIIYSCDTQLMFNPIDADENITPNSVKAEVAGGRYDTALMLVLRLNIENLIREVLETVPTALIVSVVNSLDNLSAKRLLKFLSVELARTRHIQFYVMWISELLKGHMNYFNSSGEIKPTVTLVQKNLTEKLGGLVELVNLNKYTLEYLVQACKLNEETTSAPNDNVIMDLESDESSDSIEAITEESIEDTTYTVSKKKRKVTTT